MVDLHTHSRCSDGSDSPAELIEAAWRSGVTTVSLTDHDTVAGLTSAASAAVFRGVRFISGVELALKHDGRHLHLLGFGFTRKSNSKLPQLLEKIQKRRVERNIAMVERMRKHGVRVCYAEVESEAGGAIVGRPHMASALVRLGVARDPNDAFRRLLGDGRLFHVPLHAMQLGEAVEALQDDGGHAVLAHPAGNTSGEIAELLQAVRSAGVTGVEAYHPSLSVERAAIISEHASNLGMFITGGSDYHGTFSPGRSLGCWKSGVQIPDLAACAFTEALLPTEDQSWRP